MQLITKLEKLSADRDLGIYVTNDDGVFECQIHDLSTDELLVKSAGLTIMQCLENTLSDIRRAE
jgi:hypothetical protein